MQSQRELWESADTLVRGMYLHPAPDTTYFTMRERTPALVDLWESRAGTIRLYPHCIDFYRPHLALPEVCGSSPAIYGHCCDCGGTLQSEPGNWYVVKWTPTAVKRCHFHCDPHN